MHSNSNSLDKSDVLLVREYRFDISTCTFIASHILMLAMMFYWNSFGLLTLTDSEFSFLAVRVIFLFFFISFSH